jgi:trehalose 6-phosphate phosphatase
MPTSLQPPTGGLRAVDDRHAKADARPPMPPISDHRGDPVSGASGIGAAFPLSRLAAVVFDMDGVITDTATIHRDAWKQTLDTYLERRASLDDGDAAGSAAGLGRYRPFDEDDYRRYVDGKPREAGIRDFLASRDLWLPEGESGDAPGYETVSGLGLLKNGVFLKLAAREGVEPVASTVEFVDRLLATGRRVAVISASENATHVLRAAGVLGRFGVKVDGLDARRLQLPGKPDPAIFLEAARRLGEAPGRVAIVEDALAGVQAGVRGGFAFVLAIDRAGFAGELRAAGASLVVHDLAELLETA